MSLTKILADIPKLSFAERQELVRPCDREKLDAPDLKLPNGQLIG
jgi:hypothetical protein